MKIRRPLPKTFIITTFLLGSFLTWACCGQTLITNEYWISPSTTTSNLGTLDEPFNGSTESNFDYTLASLPQGSTIHILAGTYQTLGDFGPFHLKSYDRIIGSGEDATVIQLVNNAAGNAYVMTDSGPMGQTIDSNIVVEDLTLDGNYQGGTNNCHGLLLDGPNMTAKNLKVINLAFPNPNLDSEAFAITIGGPNALIDHCLVENFWGGYNNQISVLSIGGASTHLGTVYPGSGTIRDNTIIFTNNGGGCFGINGGGNNGILIEGNAIVGVDVGVYNDTGDNTNITIVNNRFKDVRCGIYFGNGDNVRQNYIISDNMILLATNFGSGPALARAINLGYGCTNWIISGNIVGWDYPPPPGTVAHFLDCGIQQQGILVVNNTVDANFENSITTNGFNAYGNYDLTGNWLTNLDQSGLILDSTSNVVGPAQGGLGINASSWPAGVLPYTTATGVFGSTPISLFGLDLIDSLNTSSALYTLGLPSNPGTIVTNDANGNVSISGTNSAAQFVGGGSGLTGLSFYSADHDVSDIMDNNGNLNEYAYPTGWGRDLTAILLPPGYWDTSMFQTPRIVTDALANASLTNFSTSWQIYVTNSVPFATNWISVGIKTNNPIGWYYPVNGLTQVVPVPGNVPGYIYTTTTFSVPYGILTNSAAIMVGVFNYNSWTQYVTDVTLQN